MSAEQLPNPLPANKYSRPILFGFDPGDGNISAFFSGLESGGSGAQTSSSGLRFTSAGNDGQSAGSGHETYWLAPVRGGQQIQAGFLTYGTGWLRAPSSYIGYVTQSVGGSGDLFYDVLVRFVAVADIPSPEHETFIAITYRDGDLKRIDVALDEIIATTGGSFFQETMAHETGHIAMMLYEDSYGPDSLIAKASAMFGRPMSQWAAGGWVDQVKEATAEVWKDQILGRRVRAANYVDEPGRYFANRTNIKLPRSGFEAWRDMFTGDIPQAPAHDNFPLLWGSLGGGSVEDPWRTLVADGFNPDEGGTSPVPPPPIFSGPSDPQQVFYDSSVWQSVVGMPTQSAADHAPDVVYDGTSSPPRNPQYPNARHLTWRPSAGQMTLRADWGRPPDPFAYDSYSSAGIPQWDGWRLAGRMLFGSGTDGQLDTVRPGACLVRWQQYHTDGFPSNPYPGIGGDGDEWPVIAASSVPHWTTVSDESFKLPEWFDNPSWSHPLTAPEFSPTAVGTRLLISLGTHYWDGGQAVPVFDRTRNPLGAAPHQNPTVPFGLSGLLLPYFWWWWGNRRFGPYWRLKPEEASASFVFLTSLLPNNFPQANFPYTSHGGSWYPLYRPKRNSPLVTQSGGVWNQPTSGLPWIEGGISYAPTILGPGGRTPSPPQIRPSVWPYGGGKEEVPGLLNGGPEARGVARRNVTTVGRRF